MQHYEYTVMPAPAQGTRAKGAKTPTERYALALANAINEMAAEGWEYQRAETLPSDERSGIASRQTLWHNVLIFRRAVEEPAAMPGTEAPSPLPEYPAIAQPPAAPAPVAPPAPLPEAAAPAPAEPARVTAPAQPAEPVKAPPPPPQPAPEAAPEPMPEPAPQKPTGPRLGPAR